MLSFNDSLFTLNHVYNVSSSWLIILIRLCTFESEYKILVSSAIK